MKIIKAQSNLIRPRRQSHFGGDWMTSASSIHLNYGSVNKWHPSFRGCATVTLPFTICPLMPFVPRIPASVSCHLKQQWFPQPAASEHVAPLALRGSVAMCVSLCAEGHLVLRYVWHAWGHLAWHHSLPAISGPESKIGTYSFLQRILSDWGTEILIYWNKIYVSFHYRSPCWKIKREITHYRRTTVTFTLKVRSKRFCNYRGWDKWDFGDKYERQTQELNNFSMRNICLIKF